MYKEPLILLLVFTLLKNTTIAQYYYKDIVSNKQTLAERATLKEHKIRTVAVHSFEANGEESKGFFCEKKISKDYRRIETYTRSYVSSKTVLSAFFNEKGQLIQSTDSSELSVSNSTFEYDNAGNVIRINAYSRSNDDDFATTLSEVHLYTYNDKGMPVKMKRIKNQKDSASIDFIADEKGNISEEIDRSPHGKHYYYYYDDKNRLTDIVKYNVAKQKLLPDLIFEYNYSGQISQMVAVEEGGFVNRNPGSNYFIWKYTYDEGLRIIEKCYSKEKELLGYVEYEYN